MFFFSCNAGIVESERMELPVDVRWLSERSGAISELQRGVPRQRAAKVTAVTREDYARRR